MNASRDRNDDPSVETLIVKLKFKLEEPAIFDDFSGLSISYSRARAHTVHPKRDSLHHGPLCIYFTCIDLVMLYRARWKRNDICIYIYIYIHTHIYIYIYISFIFSNFFFFTLSHLDFFFVLSFTFCSITRYCWLCFGEWPINDTLCLRFIDTLDISIDNGKKNLFCFFFLFFWKMCWNERLVATTAYEEYR